MAQTCSMLRLQKTGEGQLTTNGVECFKSVLTLSKDLNLRDTISTLERKVYRTKDLKECFTWLETL